jgi:peptidoglycan-N-acetylglucosamine deacetylase
MIAFLCCAGAARADVIKHIPTNDRVVALTFDACEAGQRMSFDRGILDYLLAKRLPFTVFASGRFVENNKPDFQELAKLDFIEIENHSWNHPNNMQTFDASSVVSQVERTHQIITETTGRAPQFFRFPAGNYNRRGLKAVEDLGYKVVHWRWATGDPDRHESADALFNRTVANVQAGDILIFHINGRGYHTAEALPHIVERLEADGYRFVLISDYVGRPRPRYPMAPAPFTVASARRAVDRWLTQAALVGMSGKLN